jgi:AbrB family looped-hinge helix DNA binding protein
MSDVRVTMAPNGRVVIPAGMRAELGLSEGGSLVARIENGTVVLEPYKVVIDRVRALVQRHAPADSGIGVVDELLADRRVEASRE